MGGRGRGGGEGRAYRAVGDVFEGFHDCCSGFGRGDGEGCRGGLETALGCRLHYDWENEEEKARKREALTNPPTKGRGKPSGLAFLAVSRGCESLVCWRWESDGGRRLE